MLAAFVDAAPSRSHVRLLADEWAQRWHGDVDIADASGLVLFTTRADPASPTRPVLSGHDGVISGLADDGRTMTIAVPIHPGKPAQGELRVSVPVEPMTGRIHQFWTILAGVGITVLAGVALVAVALARWIGRPVRTLERATRRLADVTAPPAASTTTGPPELRRLAATFNATATRLQELIAAQRSFAGHASHQLKTPLAALRLRLENLEPEVTEAGDGNLRAALVETDRLAKLIDTLLALARGEQVTEPCELAVAVSERVDSWTPVADQRGVSLSFGGPDRVRVRAVPGGVEQIVDNLLSNALEVAPSGSAVTVTWREADATIELHVIDAGPGLTSEQRGRAWQPFWRAPGAAGGGTGLGLAVVHKLAEASGGRVRLDAADRSGIDAVVVLPACYARGRPGSGQASAEC